MSDEDPITATEEYKRFRSSIPQRKVAYILPIVLRVDPLALLLVSV